MGTRTSVLSLGPGEEETEAILVGCHIISICRGDFRKAQVVLGRGDKPTHPTTTGVGSKFGGLSSNQHLSGGIFPMRRLQWVDVISQPTLRL